MSTPGPDSPAPVTVHRTWVPLFVIALLLGAAFTSVFLGLQRDPEPRNLPVAVVGAQLSDAARAGLGDAVDLTTVSSLEEGDALVRSGDVVGVVGVTSPSQLQLDYAGSAGLSEATALRQLVSGIAQAGGATVQESDILPLASYDSRGLAAFYVVFGVTLSSFILAQLLASGGAVFGRLHHKFAVLAAFNIAIGLTAAVIAGPVYGTLPASFPVLAMSLVRLSASVASATTAMAVWLGPPGISLAVLIFTILGIAASGASIGYDLLPTWAQVISPMLPNGAATRLIRDFGYFDGSSAASSIVVLLVWFLLSLGLVVLKHRRTVHHGRHLATTANTATPAAA